jgi:hypothetical protein
VSERERAAQLDAEDPLAGFRERFVIEDPELIYLDGNCSTPSSSSGSARRPSSGT